jgi:hypothetical protein
LCGLVGSFMCIRDRICLGFISGLIEGWFRFRLRLTLAWGVV